MWLLPAGNIASSWENRIYLNNHINNILVVTRMLRGSIWCHKSLLEGDLSFFNFHEQMTHDLRFAASVAMSRETRGEMSVSDMLTMCKTPIWVWVQRGWSGWNQSAGQLWGSGAGAMYFGQWNSGQHDVGKSLTSSVCWAWFCSHTSATAMRTCHHRKMSYAEQSEVTLAIPATTIQMTWNMCAGPAEAKGTTHPNTALNCQPSDSWKTNAYHFKPLSFRVVCYVCMWSGRWRSTGASRMILSFLIYTSGQISEPFSDTRPGFKL